MPQSTAQKHEVIPSSILRMLDEGIGILAGAPFESKLQHQISFMSATKRH